MSLNGLIMGEIGEKISGRDDIKAFWIDLGCYVSGVLYALQIRGAGDHLA